MMVLVCIPLAALLAAAALGLSIRRQFQQGVAADFAESEARERDALAADAAHDRQLPAALVEGRQPPGKCLADFSAGRPAIARIAGVDLSEGWTPEELKRALARRRRQRAAELRSQVLHRAAAGALAIVVITGAAAAYRYHMISQSQATAIADPAALASFADDPFAAAATPAKSP